jgi:5-methyltetrahydrofolate--homocysteine methyltransferase
MAEQLSTLADAVKEGRVGDVGPLVQGALSSGVSAQLVLAGGLMAGMSVVGQLFKNNEMFIPEVIQSAKAVQTGMDLLRPYFETGNTSSRGVVVIGTVKGDLHDIGRNLVAMMLECNGFDVITLGIDVPAEKFVEAVQKHDPDIVAMSALLTTTRGAMGDTIQALKEAAVRDKVKVLVGGVCVNQSFADQIGADGYAPDAARAVDRAIELLAQA